MPTLRRLPSWGGSKASKVLPVGDAASADHADASCTPVHSRSVADCSEAQHELSEAEAEEERATIAAADRLFQRWAEEEGGG